MQNEFIRKDDIMSYNLQDGVWPVMLTPFTEQGEIDYDALEHLIKWYEKSGVTGLFSVCQSSEMFYLSLAERVNLAKFIKEHSTIPVLASGHVSYGIKEQVEELKKIAATGVDAVVLITGLLAKEDEDDDKLINNLSIILKELPETVPLGLYECPFPYKRLLTKKVIDYCIKSKRFYFIKDTCCDSKEIKRRIKQLEGTCIKLFNANTATLLESIKNGVAGYSGVMANFHPQLYTWLLQNYKSQPEIASWLQSILTMCSFIELKGYPENAKYALKHMGHPITTFTRRFNKSNLNATSEDEIRQLILLSEEIEKYLKSI